VKLRLPLAVILCMGILGLSACTASFHTDAPMTRFSFMHSGAHTGLIYTLSAGKGETGWQAEISLLAGEREHVLEMTEEDAERLTALAEEHNLQSWAGFDQSARNVLDGTGFSLTIGYADGQRLYAEGSNAFPKGYREARGEILDFFGELMERNGLESPF